MKQVAPLVKAQSNSKGLFPSAIVVIGPVALTTLLIGTVEELVLHVGQEIVPVPVIGLGVTTMGDVAATLVTVPAPIVMFVSFGASAFKEALISTGELPLIVVPVEVKVNVCAPVPSGASMPP